MTPRYKRQQVVLRDWARALHLMPHRPMAEDEALDDEVRVGKHGRGLGSLPREGSVSRVLKGLA